MRASRMKSAFFFCALTFSLAVTRARGAQLTADSARVGAALSDFQTTVHLAFPDQNNSLAIQAPVHTQRANDWNVIDQQAFIPLPSSAWAGIATLFVLIYRKSILKYAS